MSTIKIRHGQRDALQWGTATSRLSTWRDTTKFSILQVTPRLPWFGKKNSLERVNEYAERSTCRATLKLDDIKRLRVSEIVSYAENFEPTKVCMALLQIFPQQPSVSCQVLSCRVVFFAIMSGTLNMDITWLQLIIQMALKFSSSISRKKNRWHWNLTMLPHVTEIVLFPVYLNLIVWSHFPVLFTNRNFDKNIVVKLSLILWRFVSSQRHWNYFPFNSLPFDCHSALTELSSGENYT